MDLSRPYVKDGLFDDWLKRKIVERPRVLEWILMSSYAYYYLNETLISDELFDHILRNILPLDDKLDRFNYYPARNLITPEHVRVGSLFDLKSDDYPTAAKVCAHDLVEMIKSAGEMNSEVTKIIDIVQSRIAGDRYILKKALLVNLLNERDIGHLLNCVLALPVKELEDKVLPALKNAVKVVHFDDGNFTFYNADDEKVVKADLSDKSAVTKSFSVSLDSEEWTKYPALDDLYPALTYCNRSFLIDSIIDDLNSDTTLKSPSLIVSSCEQTGYELNEKLLKLSLKEKIEATAEGLGLYFTIEEGEILVNHVDEDEEKVAKRMPLSVLF